jgi:hypothetical protein
VDASLASVSPRVTLAMNSNLPQEFTVEETNKALAQMRPLKAPGPDVYGVCFCQKHRSIIGGEVQQPVLNFLNNGMFDPSINYAYLALSQNHLMLPMYVIITLLACVTFFIS